MVFRHKQYVVSDIDPSLGEGNMPLLRFPRRRRLVRRFVRRTARRPGTRWGRGGFRGGAGGQMGYGIGLPYRGMGNMLTNPRNVFPPGIFKEFTYCDEVQLTGTTVVPSVGSSQVYQICNLFGPEFAGPGVSHQPYAFDQIKGMYRYYRVYEFAWNLTFFDVSSNSTFAAMSLTDSGDSSYSITGRNMRDVAERPGGYVIPMSYSTQASRTWSGKVKIWEVEGLPYREWCANSDYTSLISAGPSISPLLNIGTGDLAAPVTACTVKCYVQLYFKARLWGNITQEPS